MSPASYLTAPPRVAARIVAPSAPNPALYDGSVSVALWVSLAFLVVAVLGSAALAATRGWRLWRAFRATSKGVTDAVSAVTAAAGSAEQHAVALAGGSERLTAAIDHLRASLAELAVIRSAAAEAQ